MRCEASVDTSPVRHIFLKFAAANSWRLWTYDSRVWSRGRGQFEPPLRTYRSRSENVASKRANQELPVIARFEVRRRAAA
jgi:hypothetical protein